MSRSGTAVPYSADDDAEAAASHSCSARIGLFGPLMDTTIEIPRAALVADEITKDAEFFSFGTNDLTQTTLGMSRGDSGSFLPHYAEMDIVPNDPCASIDQKGVGRLMEIARDLDRKTRPEIKLGICGEHGGDPQSSPPPRRH
jgi:pyruvate,orthophosphate dikinase